MAGEREEKRKRRNKKRERKEQKEKKKGFYVFSIKMDVDLIEGSNFKWSKVHGR